MRCAESDGSKAGEGEENVSGIPLDIATTNRPGARLGPRGIRAASLSLAWERPWPWPVDPMKALAVADLGDARNLMGRVDEVHVYARIRKRNS